MGETVGIGRGSGIPGAARRILPGAGRRGRAGVEGALYTLATLAQAECDHDRARDLFDEGLHVSVELGNETDIVHYLEGLEAVVAAEGGIVRAARLWGAAEALLEQIEVGVHTYVSERSLHQSRVAARARLDEAAWPAAWAEGRAMSPEKAVEYALEQESAPEPVAPEQYPAGLSAREAEVLRLVATGLTNAEVVEELFLSSRTADWHLVFAGSCGMEEVGEMQRESQVVDLRDARSVGADLRMGAGELNVTGGADALMEADFAYNVADGKPDVSYEVNGGTGELSVEQRSAQGVRLGGDARNEWDVRFNDEVLADLHVEMGARESDLDLDSLALEGLDLKIGAGQTMVDLKGDYEQDLAASIHGGVGEATIMLPSEIGVRAEGGIGKINAEGLDKEGDSYVNDAYGNSEVTVNVEVQGGVGEINLEVV